MERPSDSLAALAGALARRISELAWAGDAAGLAEVMAGATDASLLDLAKRVGTMSHLLDAVGARVSGEIAARSSRDTTEPLAKRMGERSATALVAGSAAVPLGRAADWCSVGRDLAARRALTGESLPPSRPAVAAALDAGILGVEAARMILDTLDELEPRQPSERLESLEAYLVDTARHLSSSRVGRLCRGTLERLDPDGAEPREDSLRAKAGFKVIHRRDGVLRWVIDAHPEAAGFLTAALDARTAPRRPVRFVDADEVDGDQALEDTRTLEQKRLDALVSIAHESLKHDPGDLSGVAVTVLVTIDHDALATGVGSATIFGVDQPVSAATGRRLACEARIIPVVLGGASQILDLGEGRRLFSEAQRLAMAVRDGGCIWPGCDEPPGRCEAAHLRPWVDGGPTNLDNGALLCRFHHRRFDNDGWTMRFVNGVPWLIPPPWVDAVRTPRQAGPLPAARAG